MKIKKMSNIILNITHFNLKILNNLINYSFVNLNL